MTRNDLIKISGYYDVPTHDVQALKIALIQKGPIAISVYSRQRSFLFYSSGVYYDRDCRMYIIYYLLLVNNFSIQFMTILLK